MRKIDTIVIHCADTPAEMDIGAKEIGQWHKDRGWAGIGYHFVIRRDGTIEEGRPISRPGAHVRGHNKHSIGICMVGGKGGANFTAQQWSSLQAWTVTMRNRFKGAKVVGHCDLDKGKTCPNFDVKAWLEYM